MVGRECCCSLIFMLSSSLRLSVASREGPFILKLIQPLPLND